MRRARLVAGVDAETDAALPPAIELAERGEEQRSPDSIPAPGLADTDRPDPTDSEPQCVDLCSDHLVTRTDQVDERWIPPVAPEDGALPVVEVVGHVAPVLGERLLGDRVQDLL